MPDPVILELAVNGATPRSRNRHVPRDPGEIAEVALAAVELGASIIHNHNDEPMFTPDGVHAVEPYLASWRPVLDRYPELLMYPTMAAGARGIGVEQRWAHVEELARLGLGGMTLVDPGSVNLGLTSDGSIAHGAGDGPYANPLSDIGYMFARSADLGAAPSISVFEPGFLRATLTWQRCGLLPAGAMVKLYFGGQLEFGLPPTAAVKAARPAGSRCRADHAHHGRRAGRAGWGGLVQRHADTGEQQGVAWFAQEGGYLAVDEGHAGGAGAERVGG
jgi:3-keto-5-aminohexanoate cleavage enzyme